MRIACLIRLLLNIIAIQSYVPTCKHNTYLSYHFELRWQSSYPVIN
jgi:hypothetical protein